MNQKIAVTCNDAGSIKPFAQSSRVVVFQKTSGAWLATNFYPAQFSNDIGALRSEIRSLAENLGDCRILASREVAGIAYQEMTRLGFHIFEADTVSDAMLNNIVSDIEEVEYEQPPSIPQAPFSPLNDGHYFLDLAKLQEAHPEISSKKAFRIFLEREPFLSFTLLCAHLPPWAGEVAASRDLVIREEQMQNGILKATFSPKEPKH